MTSTAAARAAEQHAGGVGESASSARVAPPRLSATGVFAVALAGFCSFLALYATQPILPLLEAQFRVSKAGAGLTVSAGTLAVALAAPLVGLFADRVSRRRLMIASVFALVVPTVLAATARTFGELLVWRFLQGAVVPGVYAVAIAYITEEAGAARVGTVMAAFITGNVLGGFVGRVAAGIVTAHGGWRAAFVVLGAINLAGAIVVWRWLPHARHSTPAPARRGAPRERRPVELLRAPPLVATYAVGFTVLFSLVATFTYVNFRLGAPPFNLGPAALSGVFVVYLAGAMVTPTAGRWVDRAGSRTVLTVTFATGAAGILLTFSSSLAVVLLGLVICCTAGFVGQASAATYLRIAAPAPVRVLASGVYVTCYYVGGSVGGVLPGLTWTYAGWGGCVAFVIAAQLLAIAIARRWWPRTAAASG
jgi:YNFM family putative membrane transporter